MLFHNVWFLCVLLMFRSQIDEWLEHAPVFSSGSAVEIENACKNLDDFLQSRNFLVGYSFSIADVAIWSGLAGRSSDNTYLCHLI
jgi:glutathione S-transferase